MKLSKSFKSKFVGVLKIVGIVAAVLIVLGFVFPLLQRYVPSLQQAINLPSFDKGYDQAVEQSSGRAVGGFAAEESLSSYDSSYSTSPIYPPSPPDAGGTMGEGAEDFEVVEYTAYVETRDLEKDCDTVAALKKLEYVTFESANEYDKGCDFNFKVKKANAEEILAVIEGLDPKDLSKNVYTIKRAIENILNEREILEKKGASIDETLESSISAYDEITKLATQTRDAEALAKIIDSKLQLIERLTQERININEQLNRLQQSEVRQLDQLEYTYFYVSVYENKFVDFEDLKDSWKLALQELIINISVVIQGLSLGLVALLLFTLQYVVYLLILVVVARYAWRFAKRIWQK